ncbi:DUF4169 family protein [Minwuia sp.]|uniref:DUF4169 family protein n=1 Tax=Minwuia sp. TaxID=2493630 RepID=UPI003A946C23
MNKVVNLNQVRKRKRRVEAAKKADENRIRHGRTRAERERLSAETRRKRALLDGKQIETDDGF